MDEGRTPHDGEIDEGDLRVSDRERDGTIDVLAEAATDGRLTLDEYSERVGSALVSVTRRDLAALTRDLVPVEHQTTPLLASVIPERVGAVFGSERRFGRFPMPAVLEVRAIFGECTVDLLEATLHARVTVLDVKVVFGSVEILVPDGVQVRMSGVSIFGSRSCTTDQDPPASAPTIEVRGRAVFGEISVRRAAGRRQIAR